MDDWMDQATRDRWRQLVEVERWAEARVPRRRSWTDADLASFVERTATASGVPLVPTDPVALSMLGSLIRQP